MRDLIQALEEASASIRKKLEQYKRELGPNLNHYLGEDPIFELDDIKSIRKVKGGAVKITFHNDDPMWYYKGHEITQDTSVPNGYYGRWQSGKKGAGSLADLLRDL